jgi:hypothetical protein
MTSIDITWGAILKLMFAGFGTYIFLPAALILRDWVLQQVIRLFILNEKFEKKISEYGWRQAAWESHFLKSYGSGYRNGVKHYTIGDEEVDESSYFEFSAKQHEAQQKLRHLTVEINNKSALLNWLLKHYKMQESNPIPDWVKEEYERFANKNAKS